MRYFSEREGHEVPRNSVEVSEVVWRGIRSLIRARVEDGSFAATYRENCFDGPIPIGTDDAAFRDAMRARIQGLPDWPWIENTGWNGTSEIPPTLKILDMIEFCWASIGKPISRGYHDFGKHNHLTFDKDAGREQFRADVEDIFRRNGIAYMLTEGGHIERLVPPVLQDALDRLETNTGDLELDRLLDTAPRKFLNPNPETRREALEALWDVWERLKTLDGQGDKKAQANAMLDKTAGKTSSKFRDALEREAIELTGIGNNLRIRHSETNQEMIATSEQVDYLFCRLFSLIQLILDSR